MKEQHEDEEQNKQTGRKKATGRKRLQQLASIIAKYIDIRNNAMNCDTMNHNDAYDITNNPLSYHYYWMVYHALTVLCFLHITPFSCTDNICTK